MTELDTLKVLGLIVVLLSLQLLDYENKQTDLLNRTLDDLEISMDSVSSNTTKGKYLLDKISSTDYNKYDRTSMNLSTGVHLHVHPTTTNINSARRSTYAMPRTLNFHGSVVYDSLYI